MNGLYTSAYLGAPVPSLAFHYFVKNLDILLEEKKVKFSGYYCVMGT